MGRKSTGANRWHYSAVLGEEIGLAVERYALDQNLHTSNAIRELVIVGLSGQPGMVLTERIRQAIQDVRENVAKRSAQFYQEVSNDYAEVAREFIRQRGGIDDG